jgi:trans-aconitate methyltransferase
LPEKQLDFLDVGYGTGALSAAILARCDQKSLLSIDPSEWFLAKARAAVLWCLNCHFSGATSYCSVLSGGEGVCRRVVHHASSVAGRF